jgi:hypothetical protein
MRPEQFEAALARLPRWLLALAILGTAVAGSFKGLSAAGGFLVGAIAAWFNLRLIERSVDRFLRLAAANPARRPRAGVFLKFAGLLLAAFVIIRYSGFSMGAALTGFMVCPAAVVLEIVYELMNYDA